MNFMAANEPGKEKLLAGNEAIARGCASYTGNPSSDLIQDLANFGPGLNIRLEWSVDEKVAL